MNLLQGPQKTKVIAAFLLICILSAFSAPMVDAEYSKMEQYNLGLERYNAGDYQTAVYYFEQAAEKGDADAQYNLAWMYYNGKGTQQDHAAAAQWYTKAAEQGQTAAQNNLAWMYHNGEGVPQDFILSYAWFDLAASHGYVEAVKYKEEIASALSPYQLKKALQLTTELDNRIFGQYRPQPSPPPASDTPQSNSYATDANQSTPAPSAEGGQPLSGQDYFRAQHAKQTAYEQAERKNFENNLVTSRMPDGTLRFSATNANLPPAENVEGGFRGWDAAQKQIQGQKGMATPASNGEDYVGQKVALDFNQADIRNVMKIFSQISGLDIIVDDDVNATMTVNIEKPEPWDQILDTILKEHQLNATRYGNTIRVSNAKGDTTTATTPENVESNVNELLQKAEQGDTEAQFNLGLIYYKAGNDSQAIHWFEKLAEQGDTSAQYNLGLIYAQNNNNIESYKWFSLAASQGNPDAIKMKDKIEALLSPQELTQAQQLVADLQYKIDNRDKSSSQSQPMTDEQVVQQKIDENDRQYEHEQQSETAAEQPDWSVSIAFAVVFIVLMIAVFLIKGRQEQMQRALDRQNQDDQGNTETIDIASLQTSTEPGGKNMKLEDELNDFSSKQKIYRNKLLRESRDQIGIKESKNGSGGILDADLVSDSRRGLNNWGTEELSRIYTDHNENEWTKEAFEAMRQILLAREEALNLESLQNNQNDAKQTNDPGPATPAGTPISKTGTKKCPYCAEEIKAEAVKCRFCGEFLNTTVPDSNSKDRSQEVAVAQTITVGVNESGKFLGGVHHPWRRFFARTFDYLTIGFLTFFAIGFTIGLFFPNKIKAFTVGVSNPIIASIFLVVLYIPIEASLLAVFGNTPGKWLFGISVKTFSGLNLSFIQALKRSLLIAFYGLGLGIVIVSLFTQLFAYRRLTKTGITLWDSSTECVVTHKTWGPARTIACVGSLILVFVTMTLINEAFK